MQNPSVPTRQYPLPPRRVPNLVGKVFNKLTVIGFFGQDARNNSLWACQCDCGNLKEGIRGYDLRNGQVKSCGCLVGQNLKQFITHGMTNHPLYKIWEGIKSRCYNPNATMAEKYFHAGVKMCDEWEKDPTPFIEWALKNGWVKGMEIDKDIIPTKLGIPAKLYSPEMCSVVTSKENMNWRANCHYLEYNGIKASLSKWGQLSGVSGKQIKRNLDKGWTPEEAIFNRRNVEKNN